MKRLGLVYVTSVLLSIGCATWSTGSIDSSTATTTAPNIQTNPSAIIVTTKDITDRKYQVLGDISIKVRKTTVFHPDPTPEQVNKKLQEKASQLGADAVIFVRYGQVGVSLWSWGALEGNGRAVKFVQ